MVDDFADSFNNPIFVFDAGYRLVAATWEMVLLNEHSRRMTEQMRVTDEDWKIINESTPSDSEIKASHEPLLVYHPEYGHRQLVASIDPHSTMGVIVVDEVNRKFKEADRDLLKLLRDGVCQKMRMDDFIRNNNGYPYEYSIRDLLDQKIDASAMFAGRFDYVNKEFSHHMYCMVVEAARSSTVLNLYMIRQKIEALFSNVKIIMYNGEIVAIISFKENDDFTEEKRQEIKALCLESRIYAGLSNSFSSITYLFSYYKQAVRAIELGLAETEKPGCYIYEDYGLRHITNTFAANEDKEVFCHPALKEILAYDRENNTQLAYSLYMYLIYERNSAAAAKAMYVHRNTLIYRLQKIDEMVDINYENPNERRYIIASYELNQS